MLYMVGSVEIDTRPFPADKVSLSASSSWAEKAVIGAAPPSEFMGEGPETLSITGKLFPFKLGGLSELQVLKGYMRQGQVVPVMRGDGARLGSYAITSISDNHSLLQNGGVGFVVGYTLSLKKLPAVAGGQASTIEGLLSLFDEVWR